MDRVEREVGMKSSRPLTRTRGCCSPRKELTCRLVVEPTDSPRAKSQLALAVLIALRAVIENQERETKHERQSTPCR